MGVTDSDILAKILVVDDQTNNLQVLNQLLKNEYQLLFAKNGLKAIELAKTYLPDLILLDVMMPGMDGFETCRVLKEDVETAKIPVIFVTALSDTTDENKGFEVGAVDYITKPVCPSIVRARVKTHLSLVGINELQSTRLEIVRKLGRAAEYKDNETGLHVIRMSHYSMLLARALGESIQFQDLILNAAPMHDIGKIGIPDRILLKPGPLDEQEWEVMKRHPEIGADILGHDSSAPLLKMASDIAFTHHEKWDGSGYPRKLVGDDIPFVGRIVAIADVFDALTTERPYKKAWPIEDAVEYLHKGAGKHFDPHMIPVFFDLMSEILDIKQEWDERPLAAVGA